VHALIALVLLQTSSVARTLERHPELLDAGTVAKELQVDLRYATTDNFMKQDVYGGLDRCFLHRDAAAMLADAQDALIEAHPELRLRVYDCARPGSVQWKMWAVVKGTPSQRYVGNPARGSIHSYGCAVDLTVATRDGTPLDMGTPYDHFGRLAHPEHEPELLATGELTAEQVANRRILRKVMLGAGFRGLSHEWWHFDCAGQAETRKRYKIIP
jgi:zinc D-Ala-D-Ala dipeptidase